MNTPTAQVVQVVDSTNTVTQGGNAVGITNSSSTGAALNDKLWMHFMRRSGVLPANAMTNDFSYAPCINHLLDPGYTSQSSAVFEDMLQVDFTIGVARVAAGFIDFITATDSTTLLGVGFYCDSADGKWHTFAREAPTGAAPVTSLHDFASTVTCVLPHRLKMIIDGSNHTAYWYIDGTLIDQWTPAAALDRVTPAANITGPKTMEMAFCPANGDVTVRSHAGAIPIMRSVWATTGSSAPVGGGGGMWASVG